MQAPLYDDVHGLALDIVNASSDGDDEGVDAAYAKLETLCNRNAGGTFDHPLQWEALGDFSHHHEAAIAAYEKGLQCALRLGLPEYTASIKFAMAESFNEQGHTKKAHSLASEAKSEAERTTEIELQAAIEGFLNELGNT